MLGRARWLIVATALVASMLTASAHASGPPLVRQSGYLTMADGIRLRYTLIRPAGKGPYPTLFEYSGYDPGTNPDAAYVDQFVKRDGGYAYLGVNLRGTGCSEGTFDFFQPQEGKDGARVIAWVTSQAWSNGKVGMIGKSYPGITQLFVAEQRPPGLAAIAPGHFFGDAYRDIARPGGIANLGFSSLWSFIARPSYEVQSSPGRVAAGDTTCANGFTAAARGNNPFLQLLQHPYDDALYAERSPITHLDKINVPMLATLSWQDEQLGSRNTELLGALDDLHRTQWWATLTNGDHGMARTPTELADLQRFFDHFLKGDDNGWDRRPRVQVWWESGRNGSRAPGWVTGLEHWSDSQRNVTPLSVPLGRNTLSWVAAAGTQGIANPYYGSPVLPNVYDWSVAPPGSTEAEWTSAPLAHDMTFLGSGSADLLITSSAADTDLEVMLTEVRPDGQEVYIQKGWLKASQRALDPAKSTALRPFQLDTAAAAKPLVPGQPTLVRVELFPFGTLIRKGSRLRLWIGAPTEVPELWSFPPPPYPAVNAVLPGSRLVLPLVPNDVNRITAYPGCGTVIRQPCRPDPRP